MNARLLCTQAPKENISAKADGCPARRVEEKVISLVDFEEL